MKDHWPIRQRREKFSNQRQVLQLKKYWGSLKDHKIWELWRDYLGKPDPFPGGEKVAFRVPGILGLGTEVETPVAGQREKRKNSCSESNT